MGKVKTYKHGNNYYSLSSKNMITKVFSNMDVLMNDKISYLNLESENDNTTKMAIYVFGSSAYTFLTCAISKYYGTKLYKKRNRVAKSAKLYINTILDTINEDEMETVFDSFAVSGNSRDAIFKVNGQRVSLTKTQITAVSILYALNHRDKIEKEIKYAGPVNEYIMTDATGNRTEAYKKLEEHRNELHNEPARKSKNNTLDNVYVPPVASTKNVVDILTEVNEIPAEPISANTSPDSSNETSANETNAQDNTPASDDDILDIINSIDTEDNNVTSNKKVNRELKIDEIKRNIEQFSICVCDNDIEDFNVASELVMLLVNPDSQNDKATVIHNVVDRILKDKPYMVNMFDMIVKGE